MSRSFEEAMGGFDYVFGSRLGDEIPKRERWWKAVVVCLKYSAAGFGLVCVTVC